MINVSRVLKNPRMRQSFTVTRQSMSWDTGRPVVSGTQSIPMSGIIVPMKTKDVVQLPFGDAIQGAIEIFTPSRLYTTDLDSSGTTGKFCDELTWHGEVYKIMSSANLKDYGYHYAIGTRKAGA